MYRRMCGALALAIGVLGVLCGCDTQVETVVPGAWEEAYEKPQVTAAPAEFPVTLSGGTLIAEELVCYQGPYWEDQSGVSVENVAGLMISNPTNSMVEFAAFVVEQAGQRLYFFVYCLPPGGRCLILEKNRHPYTQGSVTECRQLSVRWEYQNLHSEQVYYVGFGEELTLVNHSPRQLRHVTLWYKRYDPEKECYLGGVAYSAHVFRLHAQEQRVLTPEHYNAGSAKVVTVELDGV